MPDLTYEELSKTLGRLSPPIRQIRVSHAGYAQILDMSRDEPDTWYPSVCMCIRDSSTRL